MGVVGSGEWEVAGGVRGEGEVVCVGGCQGVCSFLAYGRGQVVEGCMDGGGAVGRCLDDGKNGLFMAEGMCA